MSVNSILSNGLILNELATALSPHFPDTGITTLTGDSNITCNVSGRDGTVHLNDDITIANLVVSTSDVYAEVNLDCTHSGGNSWGLYSNGTGAAFPNCFDIYNNTAGIKGLTISNTDNSTTVYGAETVNGILNIKSALQLNGSAGTSGQVLTSAGTGTLPTWSTVSGGGFTLLSRPTLTFSQSGGDASTFTVTGNLYQSGKIIYFAGDTVSGAITISGTGIITTSGGPFVAVPPTGTFGIPITITNNTATYSVAGMWNMVTVSGDVIISPLGVATFVIGNAYQINQMSLFWTTP